jgi:hypothetical protein
MIPSVLLAPSRAVVGWANIDRFAGEVNHRIAKDPKSPEEDQSPE